jgi:sialic acid synthase SpsE
MTANLFDDLFVLEMANNHLGSVDRGLAIIDAYAKVVRFNGVKAALKLQVRSDDFVHPFYTDMDNRYIKKTLATTLSDQDYMTLVRAIRQARCIPMATPFDECAVETCAKVLDIPIYKVASSDVNDWPLIEAIAFWRRPTIISTGGSSAKDLDDVVAYFEKRDIPLAINHCVAIYPSEEEDLDMNQIDYLRERYPGHTIGFSSHEYKDWQASMLIAYAKGARTFERHVDITDDITVSPYCSIPSQVDEWLRAYKRAVVFCGSSKESKRIPPQKEIKYLDNLVRGFYAKHDLKSGDVLTSDDLYLAIPLLKGQLSCREYLEGEVLQRDIEMLNPIMVDDINSPHVPASLEAIKQRGSDL